MTLSLTELQGRFTIIRMMDVNAKVRSKLGSDPTAKQGGGEGPVQRSLARITTCPVSD